MKFAPNYGGVLDAKTMAYVLEIIEGGAFLQSFSRLALSCHCKPLISLANGADILKSSQVFSQNERKACTISRYAYCFSCKAHGDEASRQGE